MKGESHMSEKRFSEKVREYLNVGHEILYLTKEDVKGLNIPKEVLYEQVEKALSMYSLGETQMPAKSHLFPDTQSVYIGMPALISGMESTGFKWVSAYNNNIRDYGLPSLSAMLLVSDYQCGWPIAFMDGVHIMETRTPAIAMVAARYLARKNSEVFGMIGLGREGRNHFDVVMDGMPNLKKILVWDVSEAAMDRAIADYADKVPVPMVKAKSLEEIVRSSDVLASATFFSTDPKPTIKDEWVPKGQTIIVTDLHSQFHPDTINRADLYVVDSMEQQKHLVEEGYFYGEIPVPHCELGHIIAGQHPGRTGDDQIIVANPSGMAVDDFAVTPIAIEMALEKGVGKILPL